MALKRTERYSDIGSSAKRPAVDLDELYQEFLVSETEEAVDALPPLTDQLLGQNAGPMQKSKPAQDISKPTSHISASSSSSNGEDEASEIAIDDIINCEKLGEASSLPCDTTERSKVPLCGFRDRRTPFVISNDIPRRNIQAAWTLAGRDVTARSQQELLESIMMYATSFYPSSMLSGHARQTMV